MKLRDRFGIWLANILDFVFFNPVWVPWALVFGAGVAIGKWVL